MARDWSATRQAEENIMQKRINETLVNQIKTLDSDIAKIDGVLEVLNTVDIGFENPSLIEAIRLLGAWRATSSRELYRLTQQESTT